MMDVYKYIVSLSLALLIFFIIPSSIETITQAVQAESKSSGNEALVEIKEGLDLKGMTKVQVIEAIGEPWRKDTTPEKARYTEKWIYSCETDKGLTYDCLFVYFMADRVNKFDIY